MTRKQHSAQFKAKVVVEAIRCARPVNELAARFGVHPVQIAHWKKQALEGLPTIFTSRRDGHNKGEEALYALAAEKILGQPVAFGRLYYSTIAQNYTTIDVPLNDWSRRRAEQALHVIDDALRSGFLPAAPRKDGCKRCEYLPVCGPYEEERIREKSQAELKDLKELRACR